MDKNILEHKKFVNAEIDRISKLSRNQNSETDVEFSRTCEAQKLANYHDAMIKNFQHERQIHLFVTLFFGLLLILSLVVTSLILTQVGINFTQTFANQVATIASFALTLILAILEAFYVAYYYRLENRIAELYPLSLAIYELEK